jgi:transposase
MRSASTLKLLTQAYVHPLIDLDRPASSQSYMWVMRSGASDHPVVLYDYAPSRAGSVAENLLSGFCGYLQTDDYVGYHAVGRKDDISHVGAGRTHVANSSMLKRRRPPKTKRLPV